MNAINEISMKPLTAKLIESNSHLKFYKLSRPIDKAKDVFGKTFSISERLTETLEKRVKEEYKHLYPRQCEIICISDATTHLERLVFVGYEVNGGCGRSSVQIGGVHTMMIHGGSERSMKAPEVYLRILASINGLKFGGIVD